MSEGTSFRDCFQEFMQKIEFGCVGAMEMVSRDLKALGMFLAGFDLFRCMSSERSEPLSIASAFTVSRQSKETCTPAHRSSRNITGIAAKSWQNVWK